MPRLAQRIHEVARQMTSYGLPMMWLSESSLWHKLPHRRRRERRRGPLQHQLQRLPRPQDQSLPRPWAAVQVVLVVVEAARLRSLQN